MRRRLTCPQGHEWDGISDRSSATVVDQHLCPVCGSAPQAVLVEDPVPGLAAETATIPPRTSSHPSRSGAGSLRVPVAAQEADEIGRLGPYRVLSVLGSGGMGVVFKAEDPSLKRLVALKAMLPGVATTSANRQRFVREAQAAAAIEHDHIVHVYQVGEDRGVMYMAMQLLRGESLADRLQRERRLSIGEVLRVARETADGLAAAHDRGFIHRDIKPANIWLEPAQSSPTQDLSREGGRVKILDFGLARGQGLSHQVTQLGVVMGTPAYMAPEQACGKGVDPRCDLFALGCVMYQMATSELPFKGSDPVSMLMAVASQLPKPPNEINPAIPQGLSGIMMLLLSKNPDGRPPSARILIQAFKTLENDPATFKVPPPATHHSSPATPIAPPAAHHEPPAWVELASPAEQPPVATPVSLPPYQQRLAAASAKRAGPARQSLAFPVRLQRRGDRGDPGRHSFASDNQGRHGPSWKRPGGLPHRPGRLGSL